jgi:glutamate-1-semialdehyde 2,1-aminomutase
VFEEEHVPWAAYGLFSNFHIFTNPDRAAIVPTRFDPLAQPPDAFFDKSQTGLVHKFRLATMVGGVDFSGSPGGITSATHGEAELEDTLKALRSAIRMLKQEGEI